MTEPRNTEPRNTQPRNRVRTRALLVLPTAALAGLLAACGGGGDGGGSDSGTTTPPPAQSTPPSGATRVTADLADFRITLSQQSFTPGTYAFVMTNTGQHDHALEIEGPGGENRSNTVGPGESTTLTVTLKDGTYEVYCPVDGHKDQGMKTEITVAGAPVNTPTTPSNPSTPGNGY
ncbi:plastocyanin/azurin family copper-binding protein [Streptomyces sp. NPDC051909]|uniref:plastocyanin/azurin family copper-binding protein n=1 Tax=Streptomyces sp. NPDC051909 TaxID=3154944 RepID=UPI003420ABF7